MDGWEVGLDEPSKKFSRNVRKNFRHGVNADADAIIEGLICWLVEDVFSGEIKTREDAAETVGLWMKMMFPEKPFITRRIDSFGKSLPTIRPVTRKK